MKCARSIFPFLTPMKYIIDDSLNIFIETFGVILFESLCSIKDDPVISKKKMHKILN
jgi:hypothetical protein